jgi:(2Fe-2S) ferredoxin/predicted O-methyltransferase YrrM
MPVLEALQREVIAAGLDHVVQITQSGSLGLCKRGPNMVVYPEGIWYSGIGEADVPEIVSQHFGNGEPVARLVNADATALHSEITNNRAQTRELRQAQGFDPVRSEFESVMVAARGFMESRAILTAVELDVFTAIQNGVSAEAAAQALGTDTRATEMLLNVLVTQRLVKKSRGAYAPAPVAARFLTSTSPESARMALMHTVGLWESWSTLTASVRAGTAACRREFSKDHTEAFIAAMHRITLERAEIVAEALDMTGYRNMLDVGGGSGGYSIAFAQKNPELSATVFDLGPVTEIARRHIIDAGVADRVRVLVGDFLQDTLGADYDMVFVSAICHMNSPEQNLALMKKSFDALASGGQIVIQDNILNAEKTEPKAGVLFALNMLVNTKGGNSYTGNEYRTWVEAAGFRDVHIVPLPGPTGLIVATK